MSQAHTQEIVVREPAGPPGMPVLSLVEAKKRHDSLVAFAKEIMVEGVDYGVVPGTDKPTLLKPGAEKLVSFFGLSVRFEDAGCQLDWKAGFFLFRYRCVLSRNGVDVGEGIGSCNSRESKYRYRWVPAHEVPAGVKLADLRVRDGRRSEFAFAIEKAETTGQYGKPPEYWEAFRRAIEDGTAVRTQRRARSGNVLDAWEIGCAQYRVENEDIADQVNTIDKMGQKRSLIAGTLITVGASQFYTQDVEDMGYAGDDEAGGAYTPPRGEPANSQPRPSRTSQVADKLNGQHVDRSEGQDPGPADPVAESKPEPGALTWDELADLYDKAHGSGGRRARTLPMDQVFQWAAKQTDKFRVAADGSIHLRTGSGADADRLSVASFWVDECQRHFHARGFTPSKAADIMQAAAQKRKFRLKDFSDTTLDFRHEFLARLTAGELDHLKAPPAEKPANGRAAEPAKGRGKGERRDEGGALVGAPSGVSPTAQRRAEKPKPGDADPFNEDDIPF